MFQRGTLGTTNGHIKIQMLEHCNLVFGLSLIHQSSPLCVLSDTGAIEETTATWDSELHPTAVAKNWLDNQILSYQTLV